MRLPIRALPGLFSVLYWSLDQADARAIYAAWDKWLMARYFS